MQSVLTKPDKHKPLLVTAARRDTVGRRPEMLQPLSCARALQSAWHVSRGFHRHLHTCAFLMAGQGWWLLCSMYRWDYFENLHYSWDKACAGKFHVFGLPGSCQPVQYLRTAFRHCKVDSEESWQICIIIQHWHRTATVIYLNTLDFIMSTQELIFSPSTHVPLICNVITHCELLLHFRKPVFSI